MAENPTNIQKNVDKSASGCGGCAQDRGPGVGGSCPLVPDDWRRIAAKCGAATKKCILVVEDDPQVSDVTCEIIERMGLYEVACVSHADDALIVFEPSRFFSVLLDLKLDGAIENGIMLATEMRRRDDDVFIAAVTGYWPVFDARLIETVDDMLKKPVDMEMLQSKLFLWSIKYNRRAALKHYIDEKILGYQSAVTDIRNRNRQLAEDAHLIAKHLGIVIPAIGEREVLDDAGERSRG